MIELNKKLKAEGRSIRFNKIDGYNTLVGINPGTVDPRNMNTLMTGIKKVTLMPRVRGGYEDNFKVSDLKEWQKFLQTNAPKIDIPAKLYSYLHLQLSASPGRTQGGQADGLGGIVRKGQDRRPDKGTPVMFQFADYAGQSYKNREMDLFKPEGWRKGENSEDFSKDGGAPITNSELRRAVKLNEVAPNDPNIIMA